MTEKAYRTMGLTGVASIAVGVVVMVIGIAAGIVTIVSGVCLLKGKNGLTF